MNNWKYYKLIDLKHKDQVVRAFGEKQQEYIGNHWVDSAIMMHYFTDISPYYNLYEEISEKEAEAIVGRNALQLPA